jgi:tetratricopeptide (TPR) repeat protein
VSDARQSDCGSITGEPSRRRARVLSLSLWFVALLPYGAAAVLLATEAKAHAADPAASAAPAAAPAGDAPAAGGVRKKRQPPPAVIPTEETKAADQALKAGRYEAAVTAAKAALTKNERYTPAMLIMAKAYYKLGKYEWTRKLWEMMQANGASDAEKAEVYQMLAFLEIDQKNVPGAIELLKKAAAASPESAVIWNNLGAQYLAAKNYREATPALEKATQLQPGFAKAFLNLGSAYRGDKDYEKAEASYKKALQLFPNYADAVFNLGILYLDAEKMPTGDTVARLNTAIQYLQKYKQMMGASMPPGDPADAYIAEAQDKIVKEQKRIERQRKAEERERQRAAQKGAGGAGGQKPNPPAGASPAGTGPAGSAPAGAGPTGAGSTGAAPSGADSTSAAPSPAPRKGN